MKKIFERLHQRLTDISFFSEFSEEEMHHIEESGFFKIIEPEQYIIQEGETERTLYVLVTGSVRVTKNSEPSRTLATLKPGTLFGEIAYVARQTRSTNIIANKKSIVFRLEEKRFSHLKPDIKVKVQQQAVKLLMDRLEEMKQWVLKLALSNPN